MSTFARMNTAMIRQKSTSFGGDVSVPNRSAPSGKR